MLLPPERRRSLFDLKILASYLAGTVVGASATAVLAWIVSGLASPLPDAVRPVLLVAGAGALWLLKEGPWARFLELPESRRQIPAEVFGGRLSTGAWRFGLELGTGLRTYAPAVAPYLALWIVVLLGPTLGQALLVGVGFGLGRAVPLMVQLTATGSRRISPDVFRMSSRAYPTVAAFLVLIGGFCLV